MDNQPGFGRTGKIMDDNPELRQKWTSLIPQGHMGVPEDLMGAAYAQLPVLVR